MNTAATKLNDSLPPAVPTLALVESWPVHPAPNPRVERSLPLTGSEILSPSQWTALGLALRLSPRELQIVQGVFDDEKEAMIADRLGISSHTVHTHLERLYRKLSVRSRTMLVVRIFAECMRRRLAQESA